MDNGNNLVDGQRYDFIYLQYDIIESSSLPASSELIGDLYSALKAFMSPLIESFNGRPLCYNGDGGAWIFVDNEKGNPDRYTRAFRAALAVYFSTPEFSIINCSFPSFSLRVSLHADFSVTYRNDHSTIFSHELQQFMKHEKNITAKHPFIITGTVYRELEGIASSFIACGMKEFHHVNHQLYGLNVEPGGVSSSDNLKQTSSNDTPLYAESITAAKSFLAQSQHFIFVFGKTCCMKTTISRRLSKLLRIPIVETSCLDRTIHDESQEFDEVMARIFRYESADTLVRTYFKIGLSVILDGTYLKYINRESVYKAAYDNQVKHIICIATECTVKAIRDLKIEHKKLALIEPHKICLHDADDEKMDNPHTNDECSPYGVKLIVFDSAVLKFRDKSAVEKDSMIYHIINLLETSIATGKLSE